jgi:WXG100 family type VII secretion target
MSQMGANLEELAALRAAFAHHAQALNEVESSVRNQLGGTTWQGPAADRFREAWASEFEPTLRRLQSALHEAGVEVGRRRDALLQAGT